MLPPCPQVHSRFVILGVGSPFMGLDELDTKALALFRILLHSLLVAGALD